MSNRSVIELRRASRTYEVGGAVVTALADVDLTVDAGEFAVVLGPSGCGKTTLLNLLGALDVATAGEVTVADHRIVGSTRGELARFRRETVSFVFQTFNLFPTLTAQENVQFGVDVTGRYRDEPRRALDVLERVGLAD
ncbi:MAG: ABC transporter ATP-binding protein, partial [Acidimicrobiia bacterium]